MPRPPAILPGHQLFLREIPPQAWLPFLGQDGIIEAGKTHLLGATFKAGKTTLLTRLTWDWLNANHTVLYVSEESEGQWAQRLQALAPGAYNELGWTTSDDVFIGQNGPLSNLSVFPGLGFTSRDLLARLQARTDILSEHYTGALYREYLANEVVILDTTKLLGVQEANEEGEWNKVLSPWIEYSQTTGSTLIAAHHLRKGDGKHGEEFAGSHVIGALFDNLITVRRDGEDSSPVRSVHSRGRMVEEVVGTYERKELVTPSGLSTGRFELEWIGAKDTRSVEHRVRLALTFDWQPTSAIVQASKAGKSQVHEVLAEMLEAGVVERQPSGDSNLSGVRVQWRLAEEIPV